MSEGALFGPCFDCGGSGRWFDMPAGKRNLAPGMIGPSECITCGGWGLVPTDAGGPVFEMIVAMRASPKWR